MNITVRYILKAILILVSILVLLLPALRNGYPLFYSDSATYIVSGFDNYVPISRPMLYCIIVRHISLSYSLWLVLIFQAGITVGLIWLTLNIFLKPRITSIFVLIISLLLSFFTGCSNYISQIMPDIFSGFMLWAFALMFLIRQKRTQWVLIALILISTMVHFSNLLTATVLSAMALFLTILFHKRIENFKIQVIQLSVIFAIPWLLIPSVNYIFDREFYLNKSSNIFFTARLLETGILKDYFESDSEAEKFSLYKAKDRLPEKAWQFLWNEDSPLYDNNCSQDGGWSTCWKVNSAEYGEMNKKVLATPQILAKFIRISFSDWAKQLFDFDIGHLTPQGKGTAFDDLIPRYFDDSTQYKNAKQYQETLFFDRESKIQRWTIALSLITILVFLFLLQRAKYENMHKIWLLLATIAVGLLVNALVCSVFSGVLNRYQGRVIWLIPMGMGMLALIFFQPKLEFKSKTTIAPFLQIISIKKITERKWFRRGLFLVAFICISLFYHADELLFVRPQSLHIWRQTNCLSITQGYYQDNLSFFEPEMQNHYAANGTNGKAAGELPVIYYLVAKLWQIFGKHEWIYRLVQLTIIGLGLMLLFEMLNHYLRNPVYAGFIGLLLYTSPMNVFFGLNFLPDTPSVALICVASYFLFRFHLFRHNNALWWSAFFFFIGIGIKITSALAFFAFGGWIFIEFVFIKPENRIFNFRIKQVLPFIITIILVVGWYLYANKYNKINGGGYSAFDILPIWRMSRERFLHIIDGIQKMHFKEFFWPYLQYVTVLIWLYLLFRIKKLSLFQRYTLVVFPIGFLGYLILWFDVLDVHDYYLITSTIVMIPIWFLFFVINKDTRLLKNPFSMLIVFLFLLVNIYSCRFRIEERHKGWMNEWYKEKLEAVGEIEPLLDKWGVGKNDLVISIPDNSINATLYLMNRKGFTSYGNDFSKPETFDHFIQVGAKYLIINDSTLSKSETISRFTSNPVGHYRNVSVFDLNALRPK